MMDTYPLLLSVVVPCYNEADGLDELHRRLTAACAPYEGQGDGHGYEIVFINDGSRDATWGKIMSLNARDRHVVGICLSRNFGHEEALTAGFDACRGRRVLVIDADLQDPPELLHEMMKTLDAGADVAYGQRLKREGEGWFKKLSARVFYRVLRYISDVPLPVDSGNFYLLDRRVVEALRAMPEVSRYIRGMVAWVGFRQVPVAYERKERFAGKTHYTFEKLLRLALDALTGFSNRPLRMAFYLGFLMLAISGLLLVYIVYSYFTGDTIRGWASLAFLLVGSQGVQWFLLGLLGEYVGRIYLESKSRPKYIVARRV